MKHREALTYVQTKLKAPKNQRNSFGGYNYRSCEDILEAVKPLIAEVGASLTLSDQVDQIGDRYYVSAFAVFKTDDDVTCSTGIAREQDERKGMDASQITGSASSYARKYALNGLFLIDDTKDADALKTDNAPEKSSSTAKKGKAAQKESESSEDRLKSAKASLNAACALYAHKNGLDYESVKRGICNRPDFEQTAEYYERVSKEYMDKVHGERLDG